MSKRFTKATQVLLAVVTILATVVMSKRRWQRQGIQVVLLTLLFRPAARGCIGDILDITMQA